MCSEQLDPKAIFKKLFIWLLQVLVAACGV